MRVLGILNLLLGIMAAFAAILSGLVILLQSSARPDQLMIHCAIMTATAGCGVWSGITLMRGLRAVATSLIFCGLLLLYAGTQVAFDGGVSGRLILVVCYSLLLLLLTMRHARAVRIPAS